MRAMATPKPAPFPWHVMCVSIVASLNNMAFGYDVGVISGSLIDMAASLELSMFAQELTTSGLNFVSGLGALAGAGIFMDAFGRRATLLVSSLLLLAGGSAVTLAQSFFVLLLGRALQGLGSGCAWCACAVYIAEMAPKEWRGGLVAISDISINVGILLGFAIDRAIILALPREPDLRWRVAMGVSLILPLFYVVAHPFLPESPRWLLMSGRKTEADRVLAWLEGSAKGRERDGPNVVSPDLEVNVPYDPTAAGHPSAARLPAARAGTRTAAYEVDASDGDGGNGHPPMDGRTVPVSREVVGQDTSWVAGGDGGDRCTESGREPRLGSPRPRSSSGQKTLSWRDSLCPPTRYEKRQVAIAIGLGLAQQLTGTEAILYYTPRILNQCVAPSEQAAAHISPEEAASCVSINVVFLVSLGVGFSKLLGEFVAAAVVDTIGRRRTMIVSNFFLSLFVLVIALRFPLGWPFGTSAIALCLAMLCFSLGPGALTFVVVSEMLPLYMCARSQAGPG
mmetsp:Transcript_5061/g.16729  ORF Transcript_5061/g.16729 Transcript_5061/m.16729 type:complete len:509 (+) Transcript_5061:98-1624(+)